MGKNYNSSRLVNGLSVDASGNVGIGTSTISAKLDVRAAATSAFSYYFRNAAGGYGGGVYNTGSNNTQLYLATSAGTENVLLNSSGSSYFNGGKVGFGITNPSSIIGLKATGADGLALEYDNSDSNNSTRIFFLSAVQNYGLFNNGGDLRLTFAATPGNTSGSSFARFTNTGRYFRMESGSGGIQFGGDTAAANALNDYEEGTWTPTITNGGWGVTALTARYTKVGRIVHCIADFNLTGSANSGVLTISGLPFVSLPTGYAANACYFNYINVDNRNLAVITLSSSSSLTFEIVPNSSGVARSAIGTDFSAGYCNVNVTYFTS